MTEQCSHLPAEGAPRASEGSAGHLLSRMTLRTLLTNLQTGRLTVITPSGVRVASVPAHPGPDATIMIHRWRALRRLVFGGDIAFAEAYVDGDWSSPDLPALIELAARNGDAFGRAVSGLAISRLANNIRHLLRANTKRGSRRNIVAHYDLGNAFYSRWLDAGMSYSAALYRHEADTLEAAQTAKQDRVIEALGLVGGERVLEIGCGWGGLAERLGRLGCRVTGITLSPAQLAYGQARIAAAGLADTVELRRQDYRDVVETFDRIVSVEMIEAVGRAYWPTYFGAIRERLTDGGRAVLQAITIADDRYSLYARAPDFIQRHIFPGGMLLSPSILARQCARAGLELTTVELFGRSYALTLKDWRHRFLAAWPDISREGFDETFRRLWEYYLAYCQGGFQSGATDVGIYRLVRAPG